MLRVRDTSALAVGSLVSGLLAYVFFATTTRALGAEAAAPVSVLWTYWSFTAAAFTFPIQHWVARSVTAHGDDNDVRGALPRLTGVVVVAAVGIGAVSWMVRADLFHRDGLGFPLLVTGLTIGSAVMGFARGTLAARRRFGPVAAVLVAENAVRCIGAAALALTGVDEPTAYGVVLLAGHLVVVSWPSSLLLSQAPSRSSAGTGLRFLGGASAGQLLGQGVLTGGPVLLALGGGTPAEVTAMFVGLALFRAPYTFALGVVSQLTGLFTTFVVHGRRAALGRALALVLGSTLVTVALAAAIGGSVGPSLVRAIFGGEVSLEHDESLLIAAGSGLALGSLVTTIFVLALNRSAGVARAWLTACAGAAVYYTFGLGDPLTRTCWTFVVAQCIAFGVLLVEGLRGRLRIAALQGTASRE